MQLSWSGGYLACTNLAPHQTRPGGRCGDTDCNLSTRGVEMEDQGHS